MCHSIGTDWTRIFIYPTRFLLLTTLYDFIRFVGSPFLRTILSLSLPLWALQNVEALYTYVNVYRKRCRRKYKSMSLKMVYLYRLDVYAFCICLCLLLYTPNKRFFMLRHQLRRKDFSRHKMTHKRDRAKAHKNITQKFKYRPYEEKRRFSKPIVSQEVAVFYDQ